MDRKKILLADDAELRQALGSSYFQRAGFVLLAAGSDEEAFALIEEEDPSLAILTTGLPAWDGAAICRRVKADPLLRATRIILVAPHDGEEETLRRCESGCDEVVGRPIDAERLLVASCRLLGVVERAVARTAVRFPVRLGRVAGKLRGGLALNLNTNGVFVETERLYPVDTALLLELALPGEDSAVQCKGRVAWVNHPEWVKAPVLPNGLGIEFLDLPVAAAQAILKALAKDSAGRLGKG